MDSMDQLMYEEFMPLGGDWANVQTFEPFGDLEFTEAKDGLLDNSFKPKPQVEQFDLHDLLDLEGNLGLEWMEQLQLQHLPPAPEDSPAAAPSIASLLDDSLALPGDMLLDDTKPGEVAVETGLHKPEHGRFLQSLLQQQEALMVEQEPGLVGPVIKLELPPSPAPSSPEAQVAPEIDFSVTDATVLKVESTLEGVFDQGSAGFIHAPLSPEEVESLLSSPPQSILSSPSPSTIDTSSLYSEDGALICSTSDLYEVVPTEGSISRGSPYSRPGSSPKSPKSKGRKQTASISPNPSELELEMMSKKDRKKLQNKNAAIRYRMKKKAEADIQKSEEEELASINSELKEKVEELSREIGYMKGLIRDVRKARGLPPHPTCT